MVDPAGALLLDDLATAAAGGSGPPAPRPSVPVPPPVPPAPEPPAPEPEQLPLPLEPMPAQEPPPPAPELPPVPSTVWIPPPPPPRPPTNKEMLKINLPTRKELEDPKLRSRLFEAIRHVESRGNPNARSAKGAEGTMQVMTEIHEKGPGFGVPPLPKNATPEQKQAHGEQYFLALHKHYRNYPDTFLAYNWGPGNVDEWIKAGRDPKKIPKEAREYAGKVTYAYRMLHFGQPLKRRDGGAVEEERQGVGSLAERARQMFNDGGAVSSGSWVDGLRAGLGSMADRARGMFGAVASRPMSEQELEDEAAMEQAAGMRGLASSPSAGMSPEDAQYYAEGLRDELVPEDLTSAGLMAASMLPAGRAARIGIGGLLMAADPSEAEAGWKDKLVGAGKKAAEKVGLFSGKAVNAERIPEDVPAQDVLVLMACGGQKVSTSSPVPLTGLYCGPMWQTFRTRQGAVSDSQVHVLSGELGLVPGTTKALPYEKVLTPEKSKEVLEQLAETQKQFVRPDGRPWDAVIIAGGGKYRDTFEEVVSRLKSQGIVNPEAAVVATRGGIGDQRKALGEFLGQANARPADRGPMMKAGGGEVRSGVGSLAAVARGMMRRAS
jgi:hypothetical protein